MSQSDHEARYRAATRKQQRRMRQWAEVADPSQLAQELAAARTLLEQIMASESPNTVIANQLLVTIGKLATSHQTLSEKGKTLIGAAEMRRIADQLIETVLSVLEEKVPDYGPVADEIIKRFAAAMEAKNE